MATLHHKSIIVGRIFSSLIRRTKTENDDDEVKAGEKESERRKWMERGDATR